LIRRFDCTSAFEEVGFWASMVTVVIIYPFWCASLARFAVFAQVADVWLFGFALDGYLA